MLKYVSGNLFSANVEALVNTVNCVGVMGKGIAYQFKRAYPSMERQYREDCKAGIVRLGEVRAYRDGDRTIINFPTKNHWKEKSKLNEIEKGLQSLKRFVAEAQIKSVAIPPLGCGNGGLNWEEVKSLIDSVFGNEGNLEILVFEPNYSFVSQVAQLPKLSTSHYVLMIIREGLFKPTKLNLQKALYFFNVFIGDEFYKYQKYKLGPYNVAIDPMLRTINDYLDYRKVDVPSAIKHGLEVELKGREIKRIESWRTSIDLVTRFCNENLDRLEALATVHSIVDQFAPLGRTDIYEKFYAWSAGKSKYQSCQIDEALSVLRDARMIALDVLGLFSRTTP